MFSSSKRDKVLGKNNGGRIRKPSLKVVYNLGWIVGYGGDNSGRDNPLRNPRERRPKVI